MTNCELQELMGSMTTEAEAEAMAEILAARGLEVDALSDREFFALIPAALDRARNQAAIPALPWRWL